MRRLNTILLATLAVPFVTPGAFADQLQPVRISQAVQTLLYLPLYVADKQGFFKEQGVDVKISTGGGGVQSWSAVLGGSADFSIHDPLYVPISKAKEGPGVVIAAIQDAPSLWIVGKKPENIQDDLAAFKGKTVTTMPEPDSGWAFFNYLLQSHHFDKKDVKLNQVAPGAEIAPLFANRTDYSVAIEPSVSQAESQGMNVVYSFPANPEFYPNAFSSLVSTEAYVSAHPKETQAVVNALEEASQFIHKDPDKAVSIGAQMFPDLDKSVVEKAVKRLIDAKAYPEHVLVTEKSWENALRVADFVGILKKDAPTSSYAANVNATFADAAAKSIK